MKHMQRLVAGWREVRRIDLFFIATCVLILGSAVDSYAQDEWPELITDRPDQTESAEVVPPGYVQIEIGTTYGENQDDEKLRNFAAPETLMRIGLRRALELRLGFSGYQVVDPDGANSDRGLGDLNVGFKWKLREEVGWRPQTALLFGLNLPTGAEGFSSERYDPAFRFSFAHTLSDRLSMGYNLGVAWETEEEDGHLDTNAVLQYTWTLGMDLTDRWGTFFELFGDIPIEASGGSAHSADVGVTYLLRENLQFDAAVGAGLSSEADDWFITMGVSYLIPLRGDRRPRPSPDTMGAHRGFRHASSFRLK